MIDAQLRAKAPELLASLKRLWKIAVWDDDATPAERAEFDAAHAEAAALIATLEGR